MAVKELSQREIIEQQFVQIADLQKANNRLRDDIHGMVSWPCNYIQYPLTLLGGISIGSYVNQSIETRWTYDHPFDTLTY
jgi:hypothetical protein